MYRRLLILCAVIAFMAVLFECWGLYNLYRSQWDGFDFGNYYYAGSIILDDEIMELDPDDGR